MTTDQFYFLVLVVLAFAGFGIALGASTIRYHAWLAKQQPQPARAPAPAPAPAAMNRMAHAE